VTIVLAHGAGAGKDHPWMVKVARAFEARGIRVVTFNFPYKEAGKSVPDRPAVLESHFARVWTEVAASAAGPAIAAGKSMGGRMASMALAEPDTPALAQVSGLVLLGYPLHPPGKPGQRRDAHLPRITAPMLFLHGTRDPFGTPEEMTALVASLPSATLHVVDGGDHSLVVRRRANPDGDSVEHAVAVAAEWLAAAVASR
jgi:predicted alpha/beta-hydrolase family hydrolase